MKKPDYIAVIKIVVPIHAPCFDEAKTCAVNFLKQKRIIEFAGSIFIEPLK